MSVKAILILCAQVLLVKSTIGQCANRGLAVGLAYDGLAYNAGSCAGRGLAYDGLIGGYAGRALAYDAAFAPAMEFTATSGGALPVSSASAIAPVGISVASDNVYEGGLTVIGELPFVGTVGMEGVVPSAGAGAVNHACGNGRNAMISETSAFAPAAGMAPLGAYGPAAAFSPTAALAPGIGLAAPGIGLAAPGIGLRGGLTGRSCSCNI